MDAEAFFNSNERESQDPITIKCKSDEKMSSIFAKFAKELESEVNEFDFFFRQKLIDNNSTIKSLKKRDNATDIDITFKKKSKIMKCPLCICNNAIIEIKNYKLNYYGCCHGDEAFNKRFDDYKKDQLINLENIKCHGCQKTQNDDLRDFKKCLQCSKEFGKAKYFCYNCSLNHHNNHILIKYDEKYYYCQKHISKKHLFNSYCFNCKENLCQECEKKGDHNGHDVKAFDKMIKETNGIKYNLGNIESKIENLKDIISEIVNSMNEAVGIFKKYCEIAKDIIGKYETFNTKFKNYQVIQTINLLAESNKEILNALNTLKDKSISLKDKCEMLIKINEEDKKAFAKIKVNPIHSVKTLKDKEEEQEEPNPPPKKKREIRNDNNKPWY